MEIHDIHGHQVSFHDGAKDLKRILRGDSHLAREYFSDAQKHGKTHIEIEGEKFTVVHNKGEEKEEDTYHIRPRGI